MTRIGDTNRFQFNPDEGGESGVRTRASLERRVLAWLNSASVHRRDSALRTSLAVRFQVRGGKVAESLREFEAPTVAGRERFAQRERPVHTSRYGAYVAVGTWPDATL